MKTQVKTQIIPFSPPVIMPEIEQVPVSLVRPPSESERERDRLTIGVDGIIFDPADRERLMNGTNQ